MTTHDTPQAALAAALLDANGPDHSSACLETTCPVAAELVDFAPTVLAAMPDWTLVPSELPDLNVPGSGFSKGPFLRYDAEAEIARLQSALDSTRGALLTVAQYDSWASEWLAKHPLPSET